MVKKQIHIHEEKEKKNNSGLLDGLKQDYLIPLSKIKPSHYYSQLSTCMSVCVNVYIYMYNYHRLLYF